MWTVKTKNGFLGRARRETALVSVAYPTFTPCLPQKKHGEDNFRRYANFMPDKLHRRLRRLTKERGRIGLVLLCIPTSFLLCSKRAAYGGVVKNDIYRLIVPISISYEYLGESPFLFRLYTVVQGCFNSSIIHEGHSDIHCHTALARNNGQKYSSNIGVVR